MSKCVDGDDALNSVINRYLKRRNYATPSQSVLNDNKFTIKELIANEFVLNIGSYDHLIEFSTSNPNKLDFFNNCNNCLDEFLNFLDQLSLENEGKLSFSFSIFIHLFIDLFVNDLKQEAKQFFNNHQHKFSSFSQFKRPFDMLNNSLKSQQLDKRLAKLRCSKVSVSISESDHKLLLEFLENESLSKNLHQIINQNFSFSLSPDEAWLSAIRASKRSDIDSPNDSGCLNGDDQEATFGEFGSLFMCNGKSKPNKELNREEDSGKMELCGVDRAEKSLEDEHLEAEYDRLINNLKALPPQLPEVLVYKLSADHSHICCGDLRPDLRYCCAGTEDSEVLVFPTEPKANYELSTSKWLAGVEESRLVEEKVDRTRQLNKSHSLYGHHGAVLDLRFVPNSNCLLSCSTDSNSILWDLNERESTNYLKKKYYGHTQPIYSLDVNCLGTHFATGSKDSTSRLFALDRSNLLRSFVGHQNSINCVHFHPNSKYLATGSSDHSVRMWDISSSNMVRVFNCQTEVYSLCYSTDGQFLASAGADSKIKIWDLSNGKLLVEFKSSHSQPINSLSFNAASTVLVSSSIDQQINFWNFRTPRKDAMSVEPLLTKNLLIKVRRARFARSDLLAAFGT